MLALGLAAGRGGAPTAAAVDGRCWWRGCVLAAIAIGRLGQVVASDDYTDQGGGTLTWVLLLFTLVAALCHRRTGSTACLLVAALAAVGLVLEAVQLDLRHIRPGPLPGAADALLRRPVRGRARGLGPRGRDPRRRRRGHRDRVVVRLQPCAPVLAGRPGPGLGLGARAAGPGARAGRLRGARAGAGAGLPRLLRARDLRDRRCPDGQRDLRRRAVAVAGRRGRSRSASARCWPRSGACDPGPRAPRRARRAAGRARRAALRPGRRWSPLPCAGCCRRSRG